MFQSLALRGLLLFVIANLVKAEVFVDDDIEAVIIQGNPFFLCFRSQLFITIWTRFILNFSSIYYHYTILKNNIEKLSLFIWYYFLAWYFMTTTVVKNVQKYFFVLVNIYIFMLNAKLNFIRALQKRHPHFTFEFLWILKNNYIMWKFQELLCYEIRVSIATYVLLPHFFNIRIKNKITFLMSAAWIKTLKLKDMKSSNRRLKIFYS